MIGAVLSSLRRRSWRSGDPPRRPEGLRGASAVQPDGCADRKEEPHEKTRKEASCNDLCCIVTQALEGSKDGEKRRAHCHPGRHEAIRCDRDAALSGWHDYRCADESNRLAAASVRGFFAGVVRKRLKLDLKFRFVMVFASIRSEANVARARLNMADGTCPDPPWRASKSQPRVETL